jgi:hypothetical protein
MASKRKRHHAVTENVEMNESVAREANFEQWKAKFNKKKTFELNRLYVRKTDEYFFSLSCAVNLKSIKENPKMLAFVQEGFACPKCHEQICNNNEPIMSSFNFKEGALVITLQHLKC